MTHTTKQNLLVSGLLSAGLLFMVYYFMNTQQVAQASAPSGAPATIATSSLAFVSPTATLIIATSSCSARIISTASTTVMLSFDDAHTPTGLFGVYQAASTTVAYDSGQYGCGAVRAVSNGTGGVITVVDSR